MIINFEPILSTDKTRLYVYDVSNPDYGFSGAITSTLRIKSTGNSIDKSFDVAEYVLSPERESYEVLSITPSQLGTSTFKDGLYEMTYSFGNNIKVRKFIFYFNAQDKYKSITDKYNYEIETGTYNIEYVGGTAKQHTEEINIASALLETLGNFDTTVTDAQVMDTLKKLNRILEILNN